MINLLTDFKEKGIQLKSHKEGVNDTTNPMGEAIFQIMAILKAMKLEVLRKRTLEGIKAARARGRNGGRKKGVYDKKKATAAASLYKSENHSIENILEITDIKSKSTLYRYLRYEGVIKYDIKKIFTFI